MKNKIYVGNLSYSTNEDTLRDRFAQYGDITDLKLIMDRETGRSKGFGFITFASDEQAEESLEANDDDFDGRPLRVNIAREGGARSGSGRGNFSGNRGGSRGGNFAGGGNRGGNFSGGNHY